MRPLNFCACVFGDFVFASARAVGEGRPDSGGEPRHIAFVKFLAALSCSFALGFAAIVVGEALGLGLFKRLLLDEEALAFIALAGTAAVFQDDGREF